MIQRRRGGYFVSRVKSDINASVENNSNLFWKKKKKKQSPAADQSSPNWQRPVSKTNSTYLTAAPYSVSCWEITEKCT